MSIHELIINCIIFDVLFYCYQILTFVNKMIDWVVSLHHACSVERVKKWGNWYIEQNHVYPSSSPVFCGARVDE